MCRKHKHKHISKQASTSKHISRGLSKQRGLSHISTSNEATKHNEAHRPATKHTSRGLSKQRSTAHKHKQGAVEPTGGVEGVSSTAHRNEAHKPGAVAHKQGLSNQRGLSKALATPHRTQAHKHISRGLSHTDQLRAGHKTRHTPEACVAA